MANSATLIGALNIYPVKSESTLTAKLYVCVFDTINTPLTILTPAAGKSVGICGLMYQEATAHNLTIFSDSTIINFLERPANDPLIIPLGPIAIATLPGGALKLQTSAAIGSLSIHVVEFSQTIVF